MKGRRVTFRLRDDITVEKKILQWIDGLQVDTSVPLKVHLVSVIARGLGLNTRPEAIVPIAPVEEPARTSAPPKTRAPRKTAHEEPRSDANGHSPVKAGKDEAFPIDRLEFD